MSSIETGSSATSSSGVQDDRPGDHRPLLLAAGQVARVLAQELLGRRRARRARAPRATRGASRRGRVVRPWICSGCADRRLDRHRRVQRGVRVLEDHLQLCAACARSSRFAQPDDVLALELDRARRSGARGRAARGRAWSCRCPTRRRGRAPRPCSDRSETPSTALTGAASAPIRRAPKRPAQREVDLEVADLEERVGVGHVYASSATAISSRSSGASPARGDLGPRRRAASTRRGCPGRGAAPRRQLAQHTRIASGQRGWKRQAGGGSTRSGGAPGMSAAGGRQRDRRAQQLARVRVRRLARRRRGRRPARRSARRTSPRPGRRPRRRCRGCG